MTYKPLSHKETAPMMQVLICTYGRDGIERIAHSNHPEVEGVEYLVSWQVHEDSPLPDSLERADFKIAKSNTKGLSVNRNIALSKATAPLLLISDDDTVHTAEGLRAIIDAFSEHPDIDIITFRFDSTGNKKYYPDHSVSINKCPKGYYISSIEIAMRRTAVQGKIWFNENFGIGATFPSGEEDVFLRDCLDSGLKGIFLPITIARHDGTTTSERNMMLDSRPQTKGAVFLRLYPIQWPLRMLVHTLREIPLRRKGLVPSPLSFCQNWLKGVRKARRMKVFPTPAPSLQYPCHD